MNTGSYCAANSREVTSVTSYDKIVNKYLDHAEEKVVFIIPNNFKPAIFPLTQNKVGHYEFLISSSDLHNQPIGKYWKKQGVHYFELISNKK